MARRAIGFSFYVNLPTQVKGKPTRREIVNNFDYLADLVSIERISNETNLGLKKRIWDASVHLGGTDYEGVLNNIGRALGYIREEAIKIELKLNSAGTPIAPNARLLMLANKIILYSDWRPTGVEVVDREIRTYQLGDTGYYLDDLVFEINKSQYFYASIIGDIRPNTFSSNLVRYDTLDREYEDYIREDKYTELDNKNCVTDSFEFHNTRTFVTEVTTDPSAAGEYKIDYVTGEVFSYSTPAPDSSCSYYFNEFPATIDILPVQAYNLQDSNFTNELFDKRELESGEEVNALPNEEGSEIYHQLFMETKVFWGK